MSLIILVLFMITFAILNRSAGAGRWWKGNGRNIYYVIPLAGLATFMLTGGHLGWAIAVATAWATYRLPGWYSLNDMGRNNPSYATDPDSAVTRDFALMVPRQCFYSIPLSLYAIYAGYSVFVAAALAFITGVLGAYGYLIGHLVWVCDNKRDPNFWAEVAAGALLGLSTWLYLA